LTMSSPAPTSTTTAARLREIMAEVLDIDPVQIDEGFARDDSSSWDSLGHLRLITALEEAFGTRFTMKEVGELDRFSKLLARLQ
jgi:acyl carrier protein